MIKNIKTKETIKDIKTLDKKKTLDSFNKKQSINTKNNVQDEKENKESNYAINKIKGASEKTLVSARIKIKKYRNQKRKNECEDRSYTEDRKKYLWKDKEGEKV